jgi:putative transcriptional regulator
MYIPFSNYVYRNLYLNHNPLGDVSQQQNYILRNFFNWIIIVIDRGRINDMTKFLQIRLKEILKQRNTEQKELAEMTGLTTRTISELCTQKTQRYPKKAIGTIAEALEIDDLNELFYLEEES